MKIRSLLAGVTLFSFVLVASTPPVLAGKKGSDSDVSMEVVGAVLNASPSASIQYGYLSLVNGLDNVFSGTPQNKTTALLTFFSKYPDCPSNQQRASSNSQSRGNVHHLSRQRSQR